MKFLLFGAGVAVAASFLVPQQAHALTATTAYVPFKLFENPAFNSPLTLAFDNFCTALGGDPAACSSKILNGVGFKIAGNIDGTGSAMVGGDPRVGNGSEDTNLTPLVSWAPNLKVQANNSPPQSLMTGNSSPSVVVPCVATQSCPGLGGTVVPMASFRTLNLNGNSYANTSVSSADISNQTGYYNGTVASTTGSANFSGGPSGLLYDFDPTVGSPASVAAKPFIMGFIALQYDYDVPGMTAVPAPLPLAGAAAAFGWTRRLRKRISSAA